MGKQDRPERVKPPCARLRIATGTYSIGNQMAVRIGEVCKQHIVARLGLSEMRRTLSGVLGQPGCAVLRSDWSDGWLAIVPDMQTLASCCPINQTCSSSVMFAVVCDVRARLSRSSNDTSSSLIGSRLRVGLMIHLPASLESVFQRDTQASSVLCERLDLFA